jgi:hypothetical protein
VHHCHPGLPAQRCRPRRLHSSVQLLEQRHPARPVYCRLWRPLLFRCLPRQQHPVALHLQQPGLHCFVCQLWLRQRHHRHPDHAADHFSGQQLRLQRSRHGRLRLRRCFQPRLCRQLWPADPAGQPAHERARSWLPGTDTFRHTLFVNTPAYLCGRSFSSATWSPSPLPSTALSS